MNPIRRLAAALGAALPVPRDLDDEPPVVDPRVDPAAREAYGRAELGQFGGPAQRGAGGGVPVTTFAIERAAEAADAEHARSDE